VIGVLVLTGFLGSGKTTLLRHLLRQPEFSRTAVIINEFGEIGLDHELVEASTDSFVQLKTGCLCCKVRSDLVETLADMLRRRSCGEVTPFTRVVIETSGLADPAPILHTLMTDVGITGRLALSSVVTTVDAVAGVRTLAREQISVKQVALADHLILTKSDLADTAELLERVAALNATAPVAMADHGRIDTGIFDRVFACSPDERSDIRGDPHVASLMRATDDAHARAHGPHDPEIQTYAIVRDDPIHAVTLTLFLETLAEHCGADLLRLKGIVNIMEGPDRPAVIHGVQHVFHPPAWLARWPSDDRRSRIILITRRVPPRWVELLLEALDAEVASVARMSGAISG
jgi:G3E family GTPase